MDMEPTRPFNFFGLPQEIRDVIYDYASEHHSTSTVIYTFHPRVRSLPIILARFDDGFLYTRLIPIYTLGNPSTSTK